VKALPFKRALVLALFSFALLHVVIFWQLHGLILQGYGDFASFYTAGKIVQQRASSKLYDRSMQWQVQQDFAPSVKIRKGPLPYIRPPFEALLFLPFAYLSYPAAFVVWTVFKVLVLCGVPFLLPKEFFPKSGPIPVRHVQGLLCLGFFPVAFDLVQGQDSILLLLVVTLAFMSLCRGSDFRSGIYLGLGLFKFHLVLPLFLVLLVKRRVNAILGFCCAALVLFLVSMWVVGWSGLVSYPRYLWGLKEAPALAGMKSWTMPNIRGLLSPFLEDRRVPIPLQLVLLAVTVCAIVIAARIWRNDSNFRVNIMGFSLCIVVTLLTGYYVNGYDLTLLILPLLLAGSILASDSTIRGYPRTLFIACVGLLLCSPLHWALLIGTNEYYWIALVLLAFALSLVAILELLQAYPNTASRESLVSHFR
jgi:alpha-1,2-mannosyltransferase